MDATTVHARPRTSAYYFRRWWAFWFVAPLATLTVGAWPHTTIRLLAVVLALAFFWWAGLPPLRLWLRRPTPAWLFFAYFNLVPALLFVLSSFLVALVAMWVWSATVAADQTGGVAAVSMGIGEGFVEMILLLLVLSVAAQGWMLFRRRASR